MTSQITDPTTDQDDREPRLSDQLPAFEALSELTRMIGHLPAPYVVVHASRPSIGLQLNSPSNLEAWRTALQIPTDSVTVKSSVAAGLVWLQTSTVVRGVQVNLTGHGVALDPAIAEASPAASLLPTGANLLSVSKVEHGLVVAYEADGDLPYGVDAFRPATEHDTDPKTGDALAPGSMVLVDGAGGMLRYDIPRLIQTAAGYLAQVAAGGAA
ncbi:hypothetical protein AB0M87_02495 [Streptomyces sp. NPDC051320]|uniref:hypothetical protein n=1 Tax=Streptomyces sp. NPDC051320 TaxID=3154644 RepID=UPI003438CBF9